MIAARLLWSGPGADRTQQQNNERSTHSGRPSQGKRCRLGVSLQSIVRSGHSCRQPPIRVVTPVSIHQEEQERSSTPTRTPSFGAGTLYFVVSGCSSNGRRSTAASRLTCARNRAAGFSGAMQGCGHEARRAKPLVLPL